jgi:hypothetical protein
MHITYDFSAMVVERSNMQAVRATAQLTLPDAGLYWRNIFSTVYTTDHRSESDEMPFIAFDEPGRGTNHQQRIIRQHLGRQRRKKTSQAKSTKLKETEQQCKPQQDMSAFLCSCDPIIPAFLRGMLENGGVVSLQPCPNCGKGHIEEQTANEHFPSLEAGPIRNNFGDPFDALPISPKPYTHNLIRHCKRVSLLTSGSGREI